GADTMRFADHSGLGYGSRISAADMARILAANHDGALPDLLKEVKLATNDGPGLPKGRAVAKTGTLNFVSSLAGYIDGQDRPLAFAIFTADEPRRDAIPVSQRERPQGVRGWNNRSRRLQKDLLRLWGKSYTA
ncbi:MAG: D-alanyl-D-alanine carboxypeptidase, partial [Pseudomonadota bacterium]